MKIGDKEYFFKPEFGNEKHIRMAEIYTRIEKNRKLLEEKLKASKDSKVLKKQIEDDEKRFKIFIKEIK